MTEQASPEWREWREELFETLAAFGPVVVEWYIGNGNVEPDYRWVAQNFTDAQALADFEAATRALMEKAGEETITKWVEYWSDARASSGHEGAGEYLLNPRTELAKRIVRELTGEGP